MSPCSTSCWSCCYWENNNNMMRMNEQRQLAKTAAATAAAARRKGGSFVPFVSANGLLITLLIVLEMMARSTGAFQDCPNICTCKWKNGKSSSFMLIIYLYVEPHCSKKGHPTYYSELVCPIAIYYLMYFWFSSNRKNMFNY